jgi:hypothetical protein
MQQLLILSIKLLSFILLGSVHPTFSSVVGNTPTNAVPKADPSVQLLIALETEKLEREKHCKDVIFTGLLPVSGMPDSDLFFKFYEDNLTAKPLLLSCRRVERLFLGS